MPINYLKEKVIANCVDPVICMSIEDDCVIVVKGYREKKIVNGFIGLDFIGTCACESLKQL